MLNTQIARLDYWRLQRLFTKENLHFSLKSTKTLLASVLHINYLLISPRGFFWFRCAERATSRNKVLNTLRNWLASSKQFNLSLLSLCSADVKPGRWSQGYWQSISELFIVQNSGFILKIIRARYWALGSQLSEW